MFGRRSQPVRDLFDQASGTRPASCSWTRSTSCASGRASAARNDEREQTLNQILVEMDGFDTATNVIVVGPPTGPTSSTGTLRPGRFDRQ